MTLAIPRSARINRPVHIVCQEGVHPDHFEAVTNAVSQVLEIAGVRESVAVKKLGVWRQQGYNSAGTLKEWDSIDWYIQESRWHNNRDSQGQLNAKYMMELLRNEPWRNAQDHYDVTLINDDMHSERTHFCVGLGFESIGTVLSTFRLKQLPPRLQLECIKSVAIHELGHVFGSISTSRVSNVEQNLGKHCTNRCIMRQSKKFPGDLMAQTYDRLNYGPFCNFCRHDLRDWFRH